MRSFLSKIFFWTYPRGSWQYDLMCLAILAFIFLTPPSVLDGSAFPWSKESVSHEQAAAEPPATAVEPDYQR